MPQPTHEDPRNHLTKNREENAKAQSLLPRIYGQPASILSETFALEPSLHTDAYVLARLDKLILWRNYMAINWQGNTQVKTTHGTPETSHGPCVAAFGNTLYSAYVGQGGQNLWLTSMQASSFPNFSTNQQIKISSNNVPLSSFRPALGTFNGHLHMVYAGAEGATLWWSWFDGNVWAGNLKLPFGGGSPQPALAAIGNTLHLVWHNFVPAVTETINKQVIVLQPAHNYIQHATLDGREPLQVSSWQAAPALGDGAALPSLAAFNGTLYAVLSEAGGTGLLIGKWEGNVWQGWTPFSITGSSPASSGGAALSVYNNELYIVYPGQGGNNLWYAYVDTLDVHAGNLQIKIGQSTPETSAPVGLATFNGHLCLAYKGQSSNNFWFSYGS